MYKPKIPFPRVQYMNSGEIFDSEKLQVRIENFEFKLNLLCVKYNVQKCIQILNLQLLP